MEYLSGYKNLNLYDGVRGLAIKILNRIDRTDAYLDKLLEIEIKNSDLSGQDKALLYEIVHGVMRWLGRIDWILIGFYKGQFSKCIPNVKNSMRVALYQILFLDRVPNYAAVNEAVDFVKKLQGQKSADLTNAVLRSIIRAKDGIRYPKKDEDLAAYMSAYYSHPSWLVKRWLNRYGEQQTEQLLIANNHRPSLHIRLNNLKTNIEKLKSLMHEVDLKFTDGLYNKEFIRLAALTNITDWKYFKEGYFNVQDESTGISPKLLDLKPGMKVLDMCAAPGGKTGHIADIMNNEGEIVALDRYESRLKILEKNLDRLGVTNVRAIVADANEFEENDFDRILIDAPCSGLGTLTKKPDIKWQRDVIDLRKLSVYQTELLRSAAKLLKVGGVFVYSTCTIEPEENWEVIERFLVENPEFELESAKDFINEKLVDEKGYVRTLPHMHSIDGAFAARLVKTR